MPQLDLSTFPSQIFWLAVFFVVLYLLMAKLAIPRIEMVIDERRNRVENDLDKAGQMKNEAEAVITAYEKALADARHQAQLTMKETSDKLAALATERQRQAGAVIAERTGVAEKRIASAKSAALADLRGVAVEVARSAAAKLVGSTIDEARAGTAVDAVLKGRA
ncbi:MAG TPA: F0F1 ATP synthase subunit B' [Stellaceae bacterium]|jgi:F-type H+-transporting ATPase subunit b|nr:F0F1 ATP synthase subunit B' [Stellaceae bacterium]